MSDRPRHKINRTATWPSGRMLLRIDEVDELLFAMSELATTYRRGGAREERIESTEELAARLRGLFSPDEWERFNGQRWKARG